MDNRDVADFDEPSIQPHTDTMQSNRSRIMATTKYLWDDETDTVVMEKDGADTTQAVYHTAL